MSARGHAQLDMLWWSELIGWREIRAEGYYCIGEACMRAESASLPRGSTVYFTGAPGGILCPMCEHRRRSEPS